MSLGTYIVSFLIMAGGLIYGAVILRVAAHWIVVCALVEARPSHAGKRSIAIGCRDSTRVLCI
jgi:hypothetical protein